MPQTIPPLADMPQTAASHFALWFYDAVLDVVAQAVRTDGSYAKAIERFPFLDGYCLEIAAAASIRPESHGAVLQWRQATAEWESSVAGHLPLRAVRVAAGLEPSAVRMLMCIGMAEEDVRFGHVFAYFQGTPGQHRPTAGLMTSWPTSTDAGQARTDLRKLLDGGLVLAINPEAPRAEWTLQTPWALWDALRGDVVQKPLPWASYVAPETVNPLARLLVPERLRSTLAAAPALLMEKQAATVIIRGPLHNGRRTALAAIAREIGRGVLEVQGLGRPEEQRAKLIGPLATALHAMPIFACASGPGEVTDLPHLPAYDGPVGVAMGLQGGLSGPWAERAIAIESPMPERQTRRRLWRQALHGATQYADELAHHFRMTSGNIMRSAVLAKGQALLEGRNDVTPCDVRLGTRALHGQVLDTLAVRLETTGDWSHLAVADETDHELKGLESRCRNRERLHDAVGAALSSQVNAGVRALFSGPSGTGKTMAARILSSVLEKDLYRLDLSAVVNKYIGETEKQLGQVFSAVEELDVILLIDEGDALLTQRTAVTSSNDRYANLETNYLLQRLEAFGGIVVITTNAGDRIDSAFRRRIDVTVEFRAPSATERWEVWNSHLSADHKVDADYLGEVSQRCTLTGGQIRNAALHASLLAMENGRIITAQHLESAVQREYRKAGAVCPLRATRAPVRTGGTG
ncbi:MAG TPA: ATP-binding protein [Tepidisphaeraceae bacterium]|nr:ATP-binding protein [Tepidisphaeraceae bacterium]